MASLDFPATPTLNQLFNASNGATYQWNGTVWVPVGVGGSTIALADTPPSNPVIGQLWWNSTLGQLFIWYDDGTSQQWVPATPVPSLAGMSTLYSEQVLTAPGADLRVNVPVGAKKIVIDFLAVPVAATDQFGMQELLGSAPQGASNHSQIIHYGLSPPNSPSVAVQGAQSSWFGFGGVASAWGTLTMMNPALSGFNHHGLATIQFNQAAANSIYAAGFWGGVASATGYRIAFVGNMNTGSFARCFVVQ
jgi:hypothetical protein